MLAAAVLSGLYCLLSTPAQAAIRDVSPAGPYRTIRSALESAAAGDTVRVLGGHWREGNLKILKPITFIGKNSPVLDGEQKHEILSIRANHVLVDGFRFYQSGYSDLTELAAVKIYHATEVIVRNCEFELNYFGIYCQNVRRCTLEQNRFVARAQHEIRIGNGIHCWKSDSMVIRNNTIRGHRDGIYFEFVSHSDVSENYCMTNVRYGLHFMFSHDNRFHQNVFSENGAGVAVMYSRQVVMTHNLFARNWGAAAYGLLMKELTGCTLLGNRFTGNTTAVFLEGTSRSRFSRNAFLNNGWALKILGDCYHDTITENNFIGNTFDVSTNAGSNTNYFHNNYWDKYRGYDLRRDGTGDVPFHPVSMYAKLIENTPLSILLLHSFLVNILDQTEKLLPTLTPPDFRDATPAMRAHAIAAQSPMLSDQTKTPSFRSYVAH